MRLPGGSVAKNLPTNEGNPRNAGLIPGSGKSLGEGNSNLFQYSCLENPMDRVAWWATVHGLAESDRAEQLMHIYIILLNTFNSLTYTSVHK